MSDEQERSSLRITQRDLQDSTLFRLNSIIDLLASQIKQTQATTAGAIPIALSGSHHDRTTTYPAGSYPVGSTFFETDRTVTYQIRYDARGKPAWLYSFGAYRNTIVPDERPTDLGVLDTGFQYQDSATGQGYQWTGSAWVTTATATPLIQDTHANRAGYVAANYSIGTEYFETDRTVRYAVRSVTGANAWVYVGERMRDLVANIPVDLGTNDAGFQFYPTNYRHLLRWNGVAWEMQDDGRGYWQPYNSIPWTHQGTCDVEADGVTVTWKTGPKFDPLWGLNNRIRLHGGTGALAFLWNAVSAIAADGSTLTLAAAVAPSVGANYRAAVGWHYCDGNGDDDTPGSTVDILNYDGTIASITAPPDLTVAGGAVLQFGTASTGAITAAVAPGISGDTEDESAHTHSADGDLATSSDSAGTPSGSVTVNNNLNNTNVDTATAIAPVAAAAHSHTASFAGDALAGHDHDVTGDTSAGSAHKHGVGTLAVDDTGMPAIIGVGCWLRK